MIMPTMFDEVRLFCMLFGGEGGEGRQCGSGSKAGLTNERTAMEVSAAIMMVVNGENSHSNAYPETAKAESGRPAGRSEHGAQDGDEQRYAYGRP